MVHNRYFEYKNICLNYERLNDRNQLIGGSVEPVKPNMQERFIIKAWLEELPNPNNPSWAEYKAYIDERIGTSITRAKIDYYMTSKQFGIPREPNPVQLPSPSESIPVKVAVPAPASQASLSPASAVIPSPAPPVQVPPSPASAVPLSPVPSVQEPPSSPSESIPVKVAVPAPKKDPKYYNEIQTWLTQLATPGLPTYPEFYDYIETERKKGIFGISKKQIIQYMVEKGIDIPIPDPDQKPQPPTPPPPPLDHTRLMGKPTFRPGRRRSSQKPFDVAVEDTNTTSSSGDGEQDSRERGGAAASYEKL